MAFVVRSFAADNVVAGFEEAAGGGDIRDINAPRNAPAKDPINHLDKVAFHINFGAFDLAAINLNIPINHAVIAGVPGNQTSPPPGIFGSLNNVTVTRVGQPASEDHLLLQHDLGFVPFYLMIYDGKVIPNGLPIQLDGGSRYRMVEAYATTTQIRLWGLGFSDASNLPAASRTYGVMVFDRPAVDPGLPLFSKRPLGVQLGRGRLKSWQKRLRLVAAGETPYGFTAGTAVDWNNGGFRVYSAAGAAYDVGAYAGSLPAPEIIQVGVQ